MSKRTLDMSLIRVFQIVLRGGSRKSPARGEGIGTFTRGGVFLSGDVHLRRSVFDYSSLFQRKKHSVNIEHQLKSKLAWSVCTKSMKLKLKNGAGAMTTVKNKF